MEKLVFDNLEEAKKYSKKYFDGFNVICRLDDGKFIQGSSSRKALLNPKLYVKEVKEVKVIDKSQCDQKRVIKSFLDL